MAAIEDLEANLAVIYGAGMAPHVIRRTMRHLGRQNQPAGAEDIEAILDGIERTSLERIYGYNARAVVAEIRRSMGRGAVLDAEIARALKPGLRAVDRVRELL